MPQKICKTSVDFNFEGRKNHVGNLGGLTFAHTTIQEENVVKSVLSNELTSTKRGRLT